MANRIGARLAAWVRMKDHELGADLIALRADPGPATRERARRLFAKVLEAPGGLRIQTIHSFAQALLAAFPAEADISPGFAADRGARRAGAGPDHARQHCCRTPKRAAMSA